MRIAHLMASVLTNHGPSNGIRVQLAAQGERVAGSEVWSMYAPQADRDPTVALSAIGVAHRVLERARSFGDPRAVRAIRDALVAMRPTILQTHLVRANLWGRVAARLEGGPPVVCTLEGVEDYFTDRRPHAAVVRLVECHSAGMVARYVAVSDGVRAAAIELLGLPAELVVTIRYAVDLSPFDVLPERSVARARLGVPVDAVVIGTVSVLEPRKNIALMLSVIAAVRRRHPTLPLLVVVVGDGPERSDLERRAVREGIADVVRFVGFRRDVAAILPALDLFVLTSRGEGLPFAVMEAMAAGVPCVVTDVGGNREAVHHGKEGFVHALSDVDGLVTSVSRLATQGDERRAFGVAARRAAFERFHPRRQAMEYDALYAEVLAERAGGRVPAR